MSDFLGLIKETTDVNKVCSGTLDLLKAKVKNMRLDNEGGSLTGEQIQELREVVKDDKIEHQSLRDLGRGMER